MGAERSPNTPLPTLEDLLTQDSYSIERSSFNDDKKSSSSPEDEVLSIISFCSSISSQFAPRELKRFKLTHLFCVIKSSKKTLHGSVLSSLTAMVGANLFRPLPPPCSSAVSCSNLPDDEVIVSVSSPIWPQLEIVYDILHWLVINIDSESLGMNINKKFILNLLALFDSEESRERESLKNIYHQMYYKFIQYRSFMRKAMSSVLLEYVFETERHNGIAEMLEIWGCIINGFAVPLKEEHRDFLKKILIPLHRAKGLKAFYKQLAYCVSQFVQKEPQLGGLVIRRIIKYWPAANSQQELFLIDELEELVEKTDPKLYRDLALPFCCHITKCCSSLHYQVAERAICVWNSEAFVRMASTSAEEVFPVIIKGIEKNVKSHWCESVRDLAENVKAILEKVDAFLYHKILRETIVREFEAAQQWFRRMEI